MPPKRLSEDDAQHIAKFPKIDHGPPPTPINQPSRATADFSNSVKKKLANSTRTGQACDRCKVRKIRCDGRPGGCSPCLQNNTACKTTDRITGRATTRGHTENLEGENAFLRQQVAELQSQLKDVGVEPKLMANLGGYALAGIQQGPQWPAVNGNEDQAWTRPSEQAPPAVDIVPLSAFSNKLGTTTSSYDAFRPLPQYKSASFGDNYLGVSGPDDLLSHIRGTSLSVFGTEIDITDFVQNDVEYNKSVFSYNHFLNVALNTDQNIEPVPLPDYKQLSEYATWYLRSLNPYTMLLDKRSFTHLVWQISQEGFQPSAAETVQVQMMLAILKYQISMRNGDQIMLAESNKHYRYALSFFRDLLLSHTLADIQAMALICVQLRNFPKPGAAWLMSSTTFSLAVELGLHRSAKAWADNQKRDPVEVEMRKRVFWTLHALTTSLSAKLGRPMCIRMEDVDVEFPEPLDDSLPNEDPNVSPFHKCSFQVGIQTSKYTVLSCQLYSSIYALRQSPQIYEETIRKLDAGIREWRDQIPYELADGGRASQENYIFSRYLDFWDQEFQLLLHHPAVCRSSNPAVISSNLDKCLEASSKMLHNVTELRRFRSLDIPWVNCTVYIAGMFTTLFIGSQRRESMSTADLEKLRADMGLWLDVIGDCGQFLGTGDKLKNAIQGIVDERLANFHEHLVKKTATDVARAALGHASQQGNTTANVYSNGTVFHDQYVPATNTPNEHDVKPPPPESYLPADDPSLAQSASQYTDAQTTTYPYSNGATAPVAPHEGTVNTFDQTSFTTTEDPAMSAAHVSALASATAGTPAPRQPDNYIYQNLAGQNVPQQYSAQGSTPNDWRQWTRHCANQMAPGQEYQRPTEYMNTASTLMELGARDGSTPAPGGETGPPVEGSPLQGAGTSNASWPVMLFGIGSNGHVGQ